MDYLIESIIFGIDSIIFITCLKSYYQTKNAVSMIQEAPSLNINKNLRQFISNCPDGRIPYACIRGAVKPLGKPIRSNNKSDIEGVVQLLKIKEHVIQKSSTGYWNDSERVIQEVYNTMPFSLENKDAQVEVVDPLAAEILDMDVISDIFHPTVPTMMDYVWSFFAGIRQRGIQSTETMLKTGSVLTGIGELVCDGEILQLQPPTNGAPFYLTNMQSSSLIKKLESSKKNYGWLCVLFGAVGIGLGCVVLTKYVRHRDKLLEEEEIKRKLEISRRDRRKKVRTDDINECVVCKSNPIEIILLPCGHVCLCEDCAAAIQENCPICRIKIERKSVAYVV